jgi:hypothetical protein
MPYAEKTGIVQIPHVGDRVRHFTGEVGTVIFVQRDAPGTQSHEHIRVRWDNRVGIAPHLAAEYSLLWAEETRPGFDAPQPVREKQPELA